MEQGKTETITFRTTTELKKAIETMAVKEDRNLSNMIEVLLKRGIEATKKK